MSAYEAFEHLCTSRASRFERIVFGLEHLADKYYSTGGENMTSAAYALIHYVNSSAGRRHA